MSAGVHIANHSNGDIRRHVVGLVESLGLGRRDLAELAFPSDIGPMIGMRNISGGKKLLDHAADRVGVYAHAPLLHHHVALLVELARHRIRDAVALHVGPELQTVGGHAPEVLSRVEAGLSVQPARSVGLRNLCELVGNHVLLGILLSGDERLVQLLQLRGVLAHPLAIFGVVRGVSRLHLCQRDLLRWVIRGADVLGALERQVLEHVCQSRLAARVVGVARVHDGEVGEDRSLRPLADNQRESIGQHFRRDALVEAGKKPVRTGRILTPKPARDGDATAECDNTRKNACDRKFHETSMPRKTEIQPADTGLTLEHFPIGVNRREGF